MTFATAGVFVLESRHDRAFRMEDTGHDFLKVLLVLAGEGALVRGRRWGAGSVGIPRRHRIEDERPLSFYAVCVEPAMLAASLASARGLGQARVFAHATWAADARGLIR